jgi:hypothetical protein
MAGIFGLSPWIVRWTGIAADLAVREADNVELVDDCKAVLTDTVAPAHTTELFPAVAELSDNVDQVDVVVAVVEGVPERAVLTDTVVVLADVAVTCHILAAERIGFHVWSALPLL